MKFRKIVAMTTAAAVAGTLISNPSILGGGISQTANAATNVSDYKYEIFPLLEPFNEYFYLKTDNPDPDSFRVVDKDSVYLTSDSPEVLEVEDTIFSDVEYEDETTCRVNGGYLLYSGVTDGGEVVVQEVTSRNYWGNPSEWGDTDIKLELPKLLNYMDYLVDTYGNGDTFFEKMDNIEAGLNEICLYSGSYINGEVVRVNDNWALYTSPHIDQKLYIQSLYARKGNKRLFASYLYPYIADSLGFPSIMASAARKLNSDAVIKWSEASHAYVNVTLDGETHVYGGQGNGKGQGLTKDKIIKIFKFDGTDDITFENSKALLDEYSKIEMESDVPQEDNLTWSKVTKSVGSGKWVTMLGGEFTYLYKDDDTDSYSDDEVGTGGSLFWSGSLGIPSDAWVDGRYINSYEYFEPGAKFEDHPTADIVITIPGIHHITNYSEKYEYDSTVGHYVYKYYDIELSEEELPLVYSYSSSDDCWKTGFWVNEFYENTHYVYIAPVKRMVEQGVLDPKYLEVLTPLTREQVEAMGVDRNTNDVPMEGLIYDGTDTAGTPYELEVGDVNIDREINMKDLVNLEQHLNDAENNFVFENVSDTDHNKELDSKDLVLLEKYLNGYDVDLQ